MNAKIVVAIVISLIIGGSIGYGISSSTISEMQSKIQTLQTKYQNLNSTYQSYVATHSYSNSEYEALNRSYQQLNARIEELEGMLNYGVHVLIDRDYYYSVRDTLQKANNSIIVLMYSMVYDPDDSFDWANDLIRELVNAKNRGVNVTVIMEYRTHFGYMDGNLDAYNYLLSNGINVRLDSESDTDHLKLVIIDNKIVYVGSHNWSESAFYYNHESSIKIISEEIAQIFKQYIETNYG